MKNILLIFYLMAMTAVASHAQTNAIAQKISKQEFETGVTQLRSLMEQNKEEEAKSKWVEIHNMMLSEFAVLKDRLKDAEESNNETDRANYMNVYDSQLTAYRDVVKYRDNLLPNKAELLANLQRYIKAML